MSCLVSLFFVSTDITDMSWFSSLYPQKVKIMDESITYTPITHVTGEDWLNAHLETFVKPILGKVPELGPNDTIPVFDPKTVLFMKICWDKTKALAGERPILLAGRDVWAFEILARIEGFPTIFRPEISKMVALNAELKPKLIEAYSNCFLLDTGYTGTVPLGLGIPEGQFMLLACSAGTPVQAQRQIFPRTKANPIGTLVASRLEGMCKYWTPGEVMTAFPLYKPKISQKIAESWSVLAAAKDTIVIAKTFMEARWKSGKFEQVNRTYTPNLSDVKDYSWFPEEGEVNPPKLHDHYAGYSRNCPCYGCKRKRVRTKTESKETKQAVVGPATLKTYPLDNNWPYDNSNYVTLGMNETSSTTANLVVPFTWTEEKPK